MQEGIKFKCVLGTYTGTQIITDKEIIEARSYASKYKFLINKYGYWNIKLNPGWTFWVITEYIE